MTTPVATLTATLGVNAPPLVDSACPQAVLSTLAQLAFNPPYKPATVNTGFVTRAVNSANSYVQLYGVGLNDIVTTPTLLYMRDVDGNGLIARLTFGSTTSTVPFNGIVMMELDPDTTLTELEIQGVGTVEYFACGAS